jgi:hypothetical protein
MASADIYGYGEEPPPYRASMDDLGYGPVNDDVLGYGPEVPTQQDSNTKYGGYRGGSNTDGLGYGSNHSADLGYGFGDDDGAGGAPPRRERTRRRCSITKYSLDAQEEVKQIFQDNDEAIVLDHQDLHHHLPSSEDECCDVSMAPEDEEADGKRPGAPKRTKSGKMKFWKRRGPARTKTM